MINYNLKKGDIHYEYPSTDYDTIRIIDEYDMLYRDYDNAYFNEAFPDLFYTWED